MTERKAMLTMTTSSPGSVKCCGGRLPTASCTCAVTSTPRTRLLSRLTRSSMSATREGRCQPPARGVSPGRYRLVPDGDKLIAEAAAGASTRSGPARISRTLERAGSVPSRSPSRQRLMRVFIDVHCDEIDDEQSRFVEVLATHAMRTGLRGRVTASHTTAMGSYNAAYSYKLQRILSRAGINLVCNPMVNLHLQGRFDAYPKRRGLTQVKEMLGAGVNVAFGHDDVMDPWFPMGTANPLQVAHVGALATQMTSPAQIAECFAMVTSRGAAALSLGDSYGIAAGRPASLIVLPATDPFDAVRRQVRPWYVISHGRVVAETPPVSATLTWPGERATKIDFVRERDVSQATWPR